MFCPPTMKMNHMLMRTLWPGSHLSLEKRGRVFLRMQRTCSNLRRCERKGPLPTGYFKFPTAIGESARHIRVNVFLCTSSHLKRRGCVSLQRFPSGGFSVALIGTLLTSSKRAGIHAGVRACLPVSANRGHVAPLLLIFHLRRQSIGGRKAWVFFKQFKKLFRPYLESV